MGMIDAELCFSNTHDVRGSVVNSDARKVPIGAGLSNNMTIAVYIKTSFVSSGNASELAINCETSDQESTSFEIISTVPGLKGEDLQEGMVVQIPLPIKHKDWIRLSYKPKAPFTKGTIYAYLNLGLEHIPVVIAGSRNDDL